MPRRVACSVCEAQMSQLKFLAHLFVQVEQSYTTGL